MGRLIRSKISFLPLLDEDVVETEIADVVGPLCTPLDILATRAVVPVLAPGDVVAVPNVGAYGLSASLVAFLGRQPPVEIAYRGTVCEKVYRMNFGHQTLPEVA